MHNILLRILYIYSSTMVSSFLLMGSPLSNATIMLKNKKLNLSLSYIFVKINVTSIFTKYLPVKINKKKYKAISQVNHAIAHIFLQLATIVNFRRVINSHISTGYTEVFIEQPDCHRYVYKC